MVPVDRIVCKSNTPFSLVSAVVMTPTLLVLLSRMGKILNGAHKWAMWLAPTQDTIEDLCQSRVGAYKMAQQKKSDKNLLFASQIRTTELFG